MLFEEKALENQYVACQISDFHNSINPAKLPQTLLLPDFYTLSNGLILSLISGILKQNISTFENIDIFELKPNENGNVLMEDVKLAISFAGKTGILSDYKFIIIHDVSKLSINSSNALLKVLEEPAKNTFFLMFYSDKKQILPTIFSRSVLVDFSKSKENFTFLCQHLNMAPENISRISDLTGGDVWKIKYFNNLEVLNAADEFQALIKNQSYINLKKFLLKYSKILNLERTLFLLLEQEFLNKIKSNNFSPSLIKKYFSFIWRKKYAILYNTNYNLILYCTINDICVEDL